MTKILNDNPITNADEDRYGIAPFAHAIATSLLEMSRPLGTAIAINGPWGAGKSSAVNLIRAELDARKDEFLTTIDFKCWWYRGEEAIALAFLQELNTALKDSLGDKVKDLVPQLGRYLLQAGPILGGAVALATPPGVASLVTGTVKFAQRFFPDKPSLEKTFRKLSAILESQPRRFLVVIDDIDRLSPDEALAIFRLLKSVGRLPNVMYLVVFDRMLADAAVSQRFPSEGPHYLEKIIQASFELPPPPPSDINDIFLEKVEGVCGRPAEDEVVRFMNVFYDVVAPYLATPRHVNRLASAISVSWPAVANNVNRADFLAMETLRLYEPVLYSAIRTHRALVTQQKADATQDDSRFAPFLAEIPESRHLAIKPILQRLFPVFDDIMYGGDFNAEWDAERRVCIDKHLDTYFKLGLSDEALSAAEIEDLLSRADDRPFIQGRLRQAASQIRRNGKSRIPVVLDALTTHGPRMDRGKVSDFFSAVFEVADSINREDDDEGGFAMANTPLRIHWLIRRITNGRFDLKERTALYIAATEHASLGWLVEFTSSVYRSFHPPGKAVDPEKVLVAEPALRILTGRSLDALREAARRDQLLQRRDLMALLYRWREFAADGGKEVQAWLARQMVRDETLVLLAKALTGHAWTTGLGGDGILGDRVARRSVRASIGKDFDLFDTTSFREGLERLLKERRRSRSELETIEVFLKAWDARLGGSED